MPFILLSIKIINIYIYDYYYINNSEAKLERYEKKQLITDTKEEKKKSEPVKG